MAVHDTAARGFGAGAADYERGRPSYPAGAVEHLAAVLGLGPGATVVDLGAGTGKLTRLLVPTGARVLAVEPVAAMRSELGGAVPRAEVLDGTAEAVPLPDGSADAVVAAQAFHWFDAPRALAEVARVLRPGGGLAMVWNTRDASVDWVDRWSGIVHAHRVGVPYYDDGTDWAAVVARTGLYGPLRSRRFAHAQELDGPGLVDRALSVSYVAALPAAERERVAADVRALVATSPDLAGRDRFFLPYRTDVFWCSKR